MVLVLALAAGCRPTAEQRRSAIYDLQADPTESNVRTIRESLDDPDAEVRATALNTLVGLAVPDAETLVLAALDDPDAFVRTIAAKRVGDLGALERSDRLVRLLAEDSDPWVRRTAAESLQRLGGEVAIRGLIPALTDPVQEVRLAAVKAIRALAPGAAKPQLARLLVEDSMWEIRVQAAGALGVAGGAEFVPQLERALRDEHELVRAAAAGALVRLGRQVPAGETPGATLPSP